MESGGPSTGNVSSTNPNGGLTWLFNVLRFCNTFAVTILAVMVTWIFFQLQFVNFTLKQESDRIDDLLKQIQESQTQEIDQLTQKVDKNQSLALYQLAGIFLVLTCLLTMFHMSTHLRNYNEPIVQRKIITILWMSPIYGLTSFLSLVFPSADGYLGVVRDLYEAYVVYNFLSFLIAVLGRGNREVVVDVLAQHANHLAKPTRCLQSFYYPSPDSSDKALANAVLFECQVLAMQFVFFRPLTSIASFVSLTVMEANGTAHAADDDRWGYFKSPNFYIAMLTNVTVFFAFTGLLKFYHAVREDLVWLQPFPKFLAIKGIVFLTFWQGLLISIFVNLHVGATADGSDTISSTNSTSTGRSSSSSGEVQKTPHEQAQEIQNILICLEMVLFSIAHWMVFPAEEWEPGYRPKEYAAPGMGLKDFAKDVSYIMSSRRRRRLVEGGDPEDGRVLPVEDLNDDGGGVDSVDSLSLEENVEGDMSDEPRSMSPYQAALQ